MPDVFNTVLPKTWTHLKGLHYPTTLNVKSEDVTINSYDEHHSLIKKLFAKDIEKSKINTINCFRNDRNYN